MAFIRKPEKGITKPWVMPHADWTTTKSVNMNWGVKIEKKPPTNSSPVYVMLGEPFCLMYEVM